MQNIKRFLRWIIHKIAVAALANAVAFGVFFLAFGIHITNSQVMKDWLSQTDTYETLINESLNLIELETSNAQTSGSLGESLSSNPFVDNETVIEALRTTLTPEFIQEQAENFIDGAYEWLDSDEQIPNFTFSLAEKNDELATKLGESLKEQFANMPTCLPEELTPEFNLLETLCVPEGIDLSNEVDRLVAELAGQEGLLASATWTGEDLIREEGEETGLTQGQVDFAKASFSGLKNGPIYLIVAGILGIPLIYLTSKSQYRGYNEIANTLFSGSLFTFIPAVIIAQWEGLITNLIGAREEASVTSVDAARAIFEPFLTAAVNDIASLTAWMSGAVLVAGGLMVLYGLRLRKLYQEQEDDELLAEIEKAREDRRIKEVKMHAKKRARHTDKTKDPKTNKPLKASKKPASKDIAEGIANDPYLSSQPVTSLDPDKIVKKVNKKHLGKNPTKPSPKKRKK